MKPFYFSMLMAALLLGACTPATGEPEEAYNFKPYVYNEQEILPGAYPATSWQYPAGTSTQEIVNRWRLADLIMSVRTHKNGSRMVSVGPQFYNLSASSQRGLADAVAQLYNAQQFFLTDWKTGKVVGTYTSTGLQMY